MKQAELLLSICIPTYNRELYLRETLDSIVSQIWSNENIIEIVISDNASSDNTKGIIEEYQKKYKIIRYIRNEINIWADRNVLTALKLWVWRYVWWITDDDILLEWWLKTVIEHLKDCEWKRIWFLQVNFNSMDKNGIMLKKAFLWANLKTAVYENIHELYKSYNYLHNWLTFYSINIYNSEILNFEVDNIPITNFPHSCIVGMIHDWNVMFINQNIVWYRTNNNSEDFSKISHFFEVFVIWHLKYMIFLFKKKSLVSQKKLFFILMKMIMLTCYLQCKSFLKTAKSVEK